MDDISELITTTRHTSVSFTQTFLPICVTAIPTATTYCWKAGKKKKGLSSDPRTTHQINPGAEYQSFRNIWLSISNKSCFGNSFCLQRQAQRSHDRTIPPPRYGFSFVSCSDYSRCLVLYNSGFFF